MPHVARSGPIQGTTSSPSVSSTPQAADPNNRDDFNYASVINIVPLNSLTGLFNTAAANWNAGHNAANQYSWVLAGSAGIGSEFTPIDPSKLNVTQYNPWVGNNNATTGFATGADGSKWDRGVTN